LREVRRTTSQGRVTDLTNFAGYRRTLLMAAILVASAVPPSTWARDAGTTLEVGSALLPVPNTANEMNDPANFKPAETETVLHEYVLLPGWLTESEFDALRHWLSEQGFTVKQAFGPAAWRTYPLIKFAGTVAQFEQAFHVTVMRGPGPVHRCYTVFDNLRMPSRFARKGETYFQFYSFGEDAIPGLKNGCLSKQ
jgi:hypothetical protein